MSSQLSIRRIATKDGEMITGMDATLEIAKGNILGHSSVLKFGRAPSGIQTTATDVWDRADATPTQSVWTAPTTARIHAIVSSNIADSDTGGVNPQGGGARTLRVFGLTGWGANEVSEDIVMDGTTAVNTVNSYVIIHRMRVLTKGGTNVNVGIITATAATDGTVTAQINVGEGQTQMAIYGIPSTQIAYMTSYYTSINKAQGAVAALNVNLVVNPEPDAELTNFLVKNTQGVQSNGTGHFQHFFNPYFKIAGPSIVKVSATSNTADVEASSGFDLILVTN